MVTEVLVERVYAKFKISTFDDVTVYNDSKVLNLNLSHDIS